MRDTGLDTEGTISLFTCQTCSKDVMALFLEACPWPPRCGLCLWDAAHASEQAYEAFWATTPRPIKASPT